MYAPHTSLTFEKVANSQVVKVLSVQLKELSGSPRFLQLVTYLDRTEVGQPSFSTAAGRLVESYRPVMVSFRLLRSATFSVSPDLRR